MRYHKRYEDENVRCVAQDIRCRIRFVIYDIVCDQCDIVCYIRHPMSNIRYRKLRHRMSNHTISYDLRIRCHNTISYVLTNDIVTYDIVCQKHTISYAHVTIIRYRMSDIRYRMWARIQMYEFGDPCSIVIN